VELPIKKGNFCARIEPIILNLSLAGSDLLCVLELLKISMYEKGTLTLHYLKNEKQCVEQWSNAL
jgi:hypothetical protein